MDLLSLQDLVTAQGAIRAGGGGDLGNSDGVFIGDYGDVHISSVNPTQSAFRVFDRSGGNGNSTIDFKIDGSATFAENITIGGDPSDGAGVNSGVQFRSVLSANGGSGITFVGKNSTSNETTVLITGDGSVTPLLVTLKLVEM